MADGNDTDRVLEGRSGGRSLAASSVRSRIIGVAVTAADEYHQRNQGCGRRASSANPT
jgi:hypothetical protein